MGADAGFRKPWRAVAVLGLVVMAGVALPATAKAHENTLTVVSWGGAYTRSQMLAYVIPYRKQTENSVAVETYNGGFAEIREQVESLNVTWDVVDLALADAVRGCREGLLETIDPSVLAPAPEGTSAQEDFLPGTLTECAVGQNVWATIVAFDQDRFPSAKPETIGDFFDVQRFPGHRGLRKTPRANLEWALLADGVPADQVYEVLGTASGQDRAFAMLDRIKPYIVWWEAGSEPSRLLAEGRVAMTSAYNGRIQDDIDRKGENFAIIWDGQIQAIELWGIVKGSWRREQALDFIRFATETQRLAEQARHIAYGPARTSSLNLLDDDVKAKLPTAPANSQNVVKSDYDWWASNQAVIDQRFDAWVAQPVGQPGPLGKAM